MRGQRKPIELHKAEGTYRPERHKDRSIQADALDGKHKPHPLLTKKGKEYWKRVVPIISKGQILITDTESLAMLCNEMAKYWELNQILEQDGIILNEPNTSGDIVKKRHPAEQAQATTLDKILKLLSRLGLTPVDRAKVVMQVQEEKKSKYDGLV